jgi:hypothetical protein
MGFFTQREHPELNRPRLIEGKFREFAGQTYNSPRRTPAHDTPLPDEPPQNYAQNGVRKDRADGNADWLPEQMATDVIKHIDRLLLELQAHRQRLLSQGARVHQDLVEYATLSQSTMQSTKIITESLTHWKRNRDAPAVAKERDRTVVQPGENSGLTTAHPATPANSDAATGEAPEASSSTECPDHTGAEAKEAAIAAVGFIRETIEDERASAPHNLPRVALLAPCARRSVD